MIEILKNLLLLTRADGVEAGRHAAPIPSERANAKLKLADEVRSTRLLSATGEELFVLSLPGNGDHAQLSANQYAVVQLLDGELTLGEAISRNLIQGRFPSGIESLLLELVRQGILTDPSGAWTEYAERDEAVEELRRGWGRMVRRLEWSSPAVDEVIRRLMRSGEIPATVLTRPGVLAIASVAFLAGAAVFLKLLSEGERLIIHSDSAFLPSLLVVLLVVFVSLNVHRLVQGAVLSGVGGGSRALSVAWLGFVPTVRFSEDSLAPMQWQNASRIRLSGLAVLSLFGFCASVLVRVTGSLTPGWMFSGLGGLWLFLFVSLSPWWDSPVLRSASQAFPGTQQPWDCWSFLWNRVLGARGAEPSARGLVYFHAYALYLVIWAALCLRLSTYALRTQVLPLFGRALRADSGPGQWAVWVLVLSVAFFFVGGLTLAGLLLLQRIGRMFPGFSIRDRIDNPATLWFGIGLALVCVACLMPADRAFLLMTLACVAVAVVAVRGSAVEFSHEKRTSLSPTAAVILGWIILVTMFRLGVLLAQGSDATPIARGSDAAPLWAVAGLSFVLFTRREGSDSEISPFLIFLLSVTSVGGLAVSSWPDTLSAVMGGLGGIVLIAWALALPRCLHFNFLVLAAGAAGLSTVAILRDSQTAGPMNFGLGTASSGSEVSLFDLEALAVFMAAGALALTERAPFRATSRTEGVRRRSPDDRIELVRSASEIFCRFQGLATELDGGRTARRVVETSRSLMRDLELQNDGFRIREEENGSLPEFGDEIVAVFERSLPIWFRTCGRRAVQLAFRHQYTALSWQSEQLIDERVLRRSALIRDLAPRLLSEGPIDTHEVLASFPTFGGLSEISLERISQGLELEFYSPGSTVVQEGDRGESMYFIVRGSAEVLIGTETGRSRRQALLREGNTFGQIALFYDTPRTATVRATSDLWAYRLDRHHLGEAIETEGPSAATAPGDLVKRINRLFQLPLFRELSHYELERLAEDSTWVEVAAGDLVMREGEAGEDFYVIDEGELEVTQQGQVVARRGPDEYVGEIALLFSIPRTATVRAARASRLIRLPGATFRRAAGRAGLFQAGMMQVARRRMAPASV